MIVLLTVATWILGIAVASVIAAGVTGTWLRRRIRRETSRRLDRLEDGSFW